MSDELTQNPATATPADETQAQPVVETAPVAEAAPEATPVVEEAKPEQTA